MTSQLVVVEGLPGCGKSTLSQAILFGCLASGRRARWYSELEVDHPLAHSYRPERDGPVEEYFSGYRTVWRRFLDERVLDAEQTVIVEAWALQDPVFGLLAADVERGRIIGGMRDLWSLLPPSTTVLYLTKGDVPAAVNHFCEARGERMSSFYVDRNDRSPFASSRGVSGMAGLCRFWTEHYEICSAILSGSTLRRISRDVSARDWKSSTHELLAELGLEVPWRHGDNLQRFCGTYVLDDNSQATFLVRAQEERLVLSGFPFFWREVDTELIPLAEATFAVQSWPATVSFEMHQGAARSLTISELQRFGQAPWPAGTYARA